MVDLLPLVKEAGMCIDDDLSTFSSLTCLLNSLLIYDCHSHYHQIAMESKVATTRVSIDFIHTFDCTS